MCQNRKLKFLYKTLRHTFNITEAAQSVLIEILQAEELNFWQKPESIGP